MCLVIVTYLSIYHVVIYLSRSYISTTTLPQWWWSAVATVVFQDAINWHTVWLSMENHI